MPNGATSVAVSVTWAHSGCCLLVSPACFSITHTPRKASAHLHSGKVPGYLRVEKEWISFWSGAHLHCRAATREASMQPLASDLSAGLLSEEQDSQLLLLTVALQRKGKVDRGEKKGQKSDCSYPKDDQLW